MRQALTVLEYFVTAAFAALGLYMAWDWTRTRNRRRGFVALAVGLLAAITVLGRISTWTGSNPALVDVEILGFLLSGYALLEFRATFIPLSRSWRLAAIAATAAIGVAAIVIGLPARGGGSRLQAAIVLAVLLVWALSVGEPAVRFWLASRGLPAVQRARLRSLSMGYAGLIGILLIPTLAGVGQNQTVTLVTQLIALLIVPLLFAGFSAPNWVRRIWREPEEEGFRLAIQELLLFSPTRRALAEKALDWAVRLVGAEAGLISDGRAIILATRGLSEESSETILARAQESGEGLLRLDQARGGVAIVADLPLDEGTGKLVVSSGPFTPLFGSDEVARLRQYSTAITAGLDRAILTERIASLERTKTEFLNLASHELRGPLTVLRGYLAMMGAGSMGPISHQVRDVLPILEQKSEEMHSLVEQMIEAARLEEGGLKLHIEPGDLREIVGEAVQMTRPLADQEHPLEFESTEQSVPVAVDRERIGTILSNLLSNAIKYSPAGGEVVLSVARENGLAMVKVSDRGIGIAPEDQARLFTRFGRIENAATAHIGGTGLGLYLSRELARLHGGDLTVQSRPGAGSVFTLAVPLADAS